MWTAIYNQGDGDIKEIWNENKRKILTEEYENIREKAINNRKVREHQDMEREVGEIIVPMELPRFDSDSLDKELKPLKENKAVGTDKLRAELYKALGESDICKEVMKDCFDNILTKREIPASWTKSRTKLIKKVIKPTPKEFRPIAIVNASYKIFFSFFNKRLEEHLVMNNLINENQMGFAKGGEDRI